MWVEFLQKRVKRAQQLHPETVDFTRRDMALALACEYYELCAAIRCRDEHAITEEAFDVAVVAFRLNYANCRELPSIHSKDYGFNFLKQQESQLADWYCKYPTDFCLGHLGRCVSNVMVELMLDAPNFKYLFKELNACVLWAISVAEVYYYGDPRVEG